jgi:menaquinone-dependent protoporphyrinogen IX oxidase
MTAEDGEATDRARNPRVLVLAASRHGATVEIAQAIEQALSQQGLTVTVIPPEDVRSLDGYDAVIIGSAVYMDHWLDPAKGLVNRFHEALTDRPVWLFPAARSGSRPASWPSRWAKIPPTFPGCSKPPARKIIEYSLASSTGEF